MNEKKIKRLAFQKETISSLDSHEQNQIRGGATTKPNSSKPCAFNDAGSFFCGDVILPDDNFNDWDDSCDWGDGGWS